MFRQRVYCRYISWCVLFSLVFYLYETSLHSGKAFAAAPADADVQIVQVVDSGEDGGGLPVVSQKHLDRVAKAKRVLARIRARAQRLEQQFEEKYGSLPRDPLAPPFPDLSQCILEMRRSYIEFRALLLDMRNSGVKPTREQVQQLARSGRRLYDTLEGFQDLLDQRIVYLSHYNAPQEIIDRCIRNAGLARERMIAFRSNAEKAQRAVTLSDKSLLSETAQFFSSLENETGIKEDTVLKRSHRIAAKKNAEETILDEQQRSKSNLLSLDELNASLSQPTDEDLAENPEVRITEDIEQLAQDLDNNPIRILNWVRQNIEFVPYYGSLKGSEMTFYDRAGNDMDTASLLIALLRAAGVPSRYAVGIVDIDYERYRKLVGVNTRDAVSSIIGTFTRPGGTMLLQSDGTPEEVRVGHCWVSAYVPSNYRGTGGGPGSVWMQMDPTVRDIQRTEGASVSEITDLSVEEQGEQLISSSVFNATTGQLESFDQTYSASQGQALRQDAEEYYNSEGVSNSFFDRNPALFGGAEIVSPEYDLVPASLPFMISKLDGTYSELPDNLRYHVRFTFIKKGSLDPFDPDYDPLGGEEISRSFNATDLAAKRITIHYLPHTKSDSDALLSAGQPDPVITLPSGATTTISRISLIPADSVEILPLLRVGGEAEVLGPIQRYGDENEFTVQITGPAGTYNETASHDIQAGGYHAVALDLGGVQTEWSNRLIEEVLDNLEQFDESVALQEAGEELPPEMEIPGDDLIGAALHVAAINYFVELNFRQDQWAKSIGVNRYRLPSVGVVSQEAEFSESIDFIGRVTRQIIGTQQNLEVDVDLESGAVVSKNRIFRDLDKNPLVGGSELKPGETMNDQGVTREEFLAAMAGGVTGSQVEHRAMERQYDNPSYSAMKLLKSAMDRGEPMTMLSKGQLANEQGREISNSEVSGLVRQKMSGLFSSYPDVAQGVVNAVQQGNMVFCPQSGEEFTAENDPSFEFYDGTGYIYMDPATAAGGYIINTNLGGSATLCGSETSDVAELVTCAKDQLGSIAPACGCDAVINPSANTVGQAAAVDQCAGVASNFITLDIEGIAGDLFTCQIARIVAPAMEVMTSQMDDILQTFPNQGVGVEPSEELKRLGDTISIVLIVMFGLTNSVTSSALDALGIGLPFGTAAIAGGLFAMMLAHLMVIDLIMETI